MAKPVTGLITFGSSPGPDNTGNLDTNYSLLAAAQNDLNTYGNFLQDTSGAANALVVATGVSLTASLAPGLRVEVKVANTNTGATTLAVNALAAQAVLNPDQSQLGPGQLLAGGLYTLEYDGANFQLQGQVFGNSLPANTVMGDGPPILWGFQLGTALAPSTLTGPVIHVAKYFTGSGGGNYEGGAAWFSTYHEGGTQPSVGLTGYVELDGGAAPCVGVHGRADNHSVAGGAMWAGWMTATDLNNAAVAAINSIESDITIGATRAHANISPAATDANGHIIVNQSGALGAFHGTRALGIYSSNLGTETSWFTGLQIGGTNQNAIVAGNANEAIQLNGGTAAANAYAGIRTAGFLTIGADFGGKLTGNVTSRGINTTYTFQSDVTNEGSGYSTSLSTQAAAFVLANLRHFEANQGVIGAGSTVTNQVGFYIAASLNGATNNYGLYGNLAAAANTFNIYCGGTAPIFAAGSLGIFGAGPPGAQPNGYGTPTGAAVQGSFAAGSITLPNLAAGVAQLILDLKKYGFLGA